MRDLCHLLFAGFRPANRKRVTVGDSADSLRAIPKGSV